MSKLVKILLADDEQECIDFVRETLAEAPTWCWRPRTGKKP